MINEWNLADSDVFATLERIITRKAKGSVPFILDLPCTFIPRSNFACAIKYCERGITQAAVVDKILM